MNLPMTSCTQLYNRCHECRDRALHRKRATRERKTTVAVNTATATATAIESSNDATEALIAKEAAPLAVSMP